ncbi:hornerin-like [Mya arenaria]|uniref:hornerin-like n=1 Tax=Mya arenaria TaxID=6604 RepID=UPI0022E183ED|nr:hornerin-like [Mya arenaria]
MDKKKPLLVCVHALCMLSVISAQQTDGRWQSNGPSVSDILRQSSILESAVMDLSSAAGESVSGFPGAHGDIGHRGHASGSGFGQTPNVQQGAVGGHRAHESLGNALIQPTGPHVDLPGEHGNNNPFAVVHRGSHPMTSSVNTAGSALENEPRFFHGRNVHHGTSNSGSDTFVDLVSLGKPNTPASFPRLNDISSKSQDASNSPFPTLAEVEAELMAKSAAVAHRDGFLNPGDGFAVTDVIGETSGGSPVRDVHIDMPGQHGNQGGQPVVHREGGAQLGIGHGDLPGQHGNAGEASRVPHQIGSAFHQGTGDVHIDLPGQHGNTAGSPVVHRDGSGHGGIPNNGARHGGSVHIDLPGQHGNTANMPVVHRESGVPHGNVHVDLPGQHGNMETAPVVHREGFQPGGILQQGTTLPLGNVHVDLPGQHGNQGIHPLVHREGLDTGVVPNPQMHHGTPVNAHVDLPGQHGNPSNTPVVHRENPSGNPNSAIPLGSFHIDLPGQHGNTADEPIVHREGFHQSGMQPGVSLSDVHVDLPGQHGNAVDFPVVHREGVSQSGGLQPVPHLGDVHVDIPGQHGNQEGVPIIHREGVGPPTGGFQPGRPLDGVHVDLPGQHGNQGNVPVVHREEVSPSGGLHPGVHLGDVHVDIPGQHGNQEGVPIIHREGVGPPTGGFQPGRPLDGVHVDLPGQHVNQDGVPVVHREGVLPPGVHGPPIHLPPGGVHGGGPNQHTGNSPDLHLDRSVPHIDGPGQHGNPLNEDAVHIPDRAPPSGNLNPARRFPFGPVVGTGVFLGTPNVPVRPRGGRDGTVRIVHDGRNILDHVHPDGTRSTGLGVVGHDNVLMGPGRWRMRGRGRGRGRRFRGGRGRHIGHSILPTPTDTSPVTGSDGVRLIGVGGSSNPLASLMRSVLTGGNAGGGLMGSLRQTASGARGLQRGYPPNRGSGMVMVRGSGNPIGDLLQSVLGSVLGKR